MHIEIDDLSRPQVHRLLKEHLANMYELSPPEQVFALNLNTLRAPGITLYGMGRRNFIGLRRAKRPVANAW